MSLATRVAPRRVLAHRPRRARTATTAATTKTRRRERFPRPSRAKTPSAGSLGRREKTARRSAGRNRAAGIRMDPSRRRCVATCSGRCIACQSKSTRHDHGHCTTDGEVSVGTILPNLPPSTRETPNIGNYVTSCRLSTTHCPQPWQSAVKVGSARHCRDGARTRDGHTADALRLRAGLLEFVRILDRSPR